MKNIIFLIILVLMVILLIEEMHILVFGRLRRNLPNIDLNNYDLGYDIDKSMLFESFEHTFYSDNRLPYISKLSASILSKWHIKDYGCILRGTKAHKQIEQKYKELCQ